MHADLTKSAEASGDDEPRLRMIRELERFLSSTLPNLDGKRVVPTTFGKAKRSARWTSSTSGRRAWYDVASRNVDHGANSGLEMGPC